MTDIRNGQQKAMVFLDRIMQDMTWDVLLTCFTFEKCSEVW